MTESFRLQIGIISVVGIISAVIGDHFGGGDHFDGGDHFGGGTIQPFHFGLVPRRYRLFALAATQVQQFNIVGVN